MLAALPKFDNTDLVFPGRDSEKPLSDMSLTAIMRRFKMTAVPHGFRSTFTDWCAERTAYPSEVREMALAHAIGNETEAAYRCYTQRTKRLQEKHHNEQPRVHCTQQKLVQIDEP